MYHVKVIGVSITQIWFTFFTCLIAFYFPLVFLSMGVFVARKKSVLSCFVYLILLPIQAVM